MRLCGCGCGQPVPLAKRTRPERGHVKGEPLTFILGHHSRLRPLSERPSMRAAHGWLGRHEPKSGTCEECGKVGKTDYAFLRHPDPYTYARADYRELCRSCHWRFDIATGARPLPPGAVGRIDMTRLSALDTTKGITTP